jgi:hypothetical protein
MNYSYYYNNVPGVGLTRNNLIYTSLISDDKKVFVQWYHNDKKYHKEQNQIVDPEKMDEKWERELKYLQQMRGAYPDLVPNVLDIDYKHRKIYLEINGPDLWQRSMDMNGSFYDVISDWDTQMIEIIQAYKFLGLHKYSMHPSSYFIVDGKLKSINYFFTYHYTEPNISISDIESHIYSTRQDIMKKYIGSLGIKWDEPQSWKVFDMLCWESFRTNYPKEFIDKILNYV